RPLETLEDEMAGNAGDPGSQALWRAHRRRMTEALARLHVAPPSPGMAKRDPFGLRAAVILLLAVGAFAAADRGGERIARALTPDIAGGADRDVQYELWFTPPAYTEVQPIYLPAKPEAAPIQVPAGSELSARLFGADDTPSLRLDDREIPFERADTLNHAARATVSEGSQLTLEIGGDEIARWTVELRPDSPPSVRFAAPPTKTDREVLHISYGAEDDYGIEEMTLVLRRVAPPEGAGLDAAHLLDEDPLVLPLAARGLDRTRIESAAYLDLTPHEWAGLPVEGTLTGRDALDQTGESQKRVFILPERSFNHPIARAIVAERRHLFAAEIERPRLSLSLQVLAVQAYELLGDTVVTLGLDMAAARLIHDRGPTATAELRQLLWDLALHVEDGELSLAERDLREIQERLLEAMTEGASEQEIEQLIDELRAALDRYLEALAQDLQQQLAESGRMPEADRDTTMVERDDLQRMIDQIQDLMESGAKDAARDLMAQLRNMLENLRARAADEMNPERGQASDMLRELNKLMNSQQDLMDQTYQRWQEMKSDTPMGPDSARGFEEDAARAAGMQDELRRALGEIMRRFGEATGQIPRPLGEAEAEMRAAGEALGRNRPGDAVKPQGRALDELRQGAEQMVEQFLNQFGAGEGANGQAGEGQGEGRDPFGRPTKQGGSSGADVDIPDRTAIQRSRQIFDELRRRSGETDRPPVERDYIDRLLRRF
ncbi:MAG: TIGR02302 family protein, partial [Rhodospirillaceae bacterium]|nr:TIGR02302 family protein [Rhodospirillaceae bacterium]